MDGLMWEALALHTGDRVKIVYKGTTYIGTIELGGVRMGDQKYQSVNQFCTMTRGICNAWAHTWIEFRAYPDTWVKAQSVRDNDMEGVKITHDMNQLIKGL